MTDRNASTKKRILQAAEELFAEHGIAATSLRQITARASVNLAAVNYHFGSRDALIEAAYARRLEPLNQARLQRLDELEGRAAGKPLALPDIVRAFIEPVLRIARDPELGGPLFVRLFGQSYTDTSTRFEKFFNGQYRDVLARFSAALGRTLPALGSEDLYWRLHFMIGATAYTIADTQLLRLIAGSSHTADVEHTLARLEPFLIAGFEAPGPAVSSKAVLRTAAS